MTEYLSNPGFLLVLANLGGLFKLLFQAAKLLDKIGGLVDAVHQITMKLEAMTTHESRIKALELEIVRLAEHVVILDTRR